MLRQVSASICLPILIMACGTVMAAGPAPVTSKIQNRWSSTCGAVTGVTGANYCFYKNDPNPKSTIYFFHGISDSEKSLQVNGNHSKGEDSYADFLNGLGPVNIVVVSFGSSWLLIDELKHTIGPADATVSVFKNKIMPFIDSKFRPVKPYVAVGHSMGGYNASVMCAAAPGLFSKCVLLNAMIPGPACDPFVANNCNGGPSFVIKTQMTQPQWAKSAPFVLEKVAKPLAPSYASACSTDMWGLFEGPKNWVAVATGRNYRSVFDPAPAPCDHDHWPNNHVLEFLSSP